MVALRVASARRRWIASRGGPGVDGAVDLQQAKAVLVEQAVVIFPSHAAASNAAHRILDDDDILGGVLFAKESRVDQELELALALANEGRKRARRS